MKSLRSKFFINLLAIIILSLAAVALALNWSLDRYFFDYQLQETARELDEYEDYLNKLYQENRNLTEIRSMVEEYAAANNLIYHPFRRGHGSMMRDMHPESRGMARMQAMMEEGFELFVGGESLGYLSWPEENDESLLAAEISARTAEFSRDIYGLLLPLGLSLAALAAVLSYYISRKLTEPIRRFAGAVKEIRRGDYQVEISRQYPEELQELYLEINELGKRLNYLERIRRESASDLSHELRTPLNNILNYLMAVEDGYLEVNEEILQDLQEEIDRLIELTNRLDDLSLAEKKMFNLKQEDVNLQEFFVQIDQKFSRQAENNGLSFKSRLALPEDSFRLDREALAIILDNLLSNAIKYTDAGGRIELTAGIKGGKLKFAVTDSGIGIEKEELDLIFERFYRTDKSRNRKTGGTGIGLAITRELVESLKGRIDVESSSRGSRFKVEIPLEKG